MFSVSKLIAGETGDFYCQLGEQTGIGATRHLLRICGLNIIVDDGVSISRKGDVQIQGRPFGDDLLGVHIDIIIITHAHIDHMGDIARLTRYHPESWIFISDKALAATLFMLHDSFKIMTANALQATKLGQPVPEITFSEEDIVDFENNPNLVVIEKKYEEFDHPDFPGFKFIFANSGHDIGAKMVKIIDPNGRRYLLTGDVASHDQEILSGAMNPLGECDVLITEATNGARPMRETRQRTWERVGHLLDEVSLRGGLALFASFMKNRSSNMALGLIKLGFVPVIDGSARTMMRIELGDDMVQGLIDEWKLIFISDDPFSPRKAWKEREELLNGQWGFHPIIAPSGTLEQGYAVVYAQRLLPDRRNAVIFPGHRFAESVSKQIFEIGLGRTINLNCLDRKTGRYGPTPVNVVGEGWEVDFWGNE